LIIKLLESFTLPEEIAIVHVPEHGGGNSPEAQGNNLADKAAKEAAFHPELQMLHLTPVVQAPSLNPVFTPLENVQLKMLGASPMLEGKWLLPDGREILSKPLVRVVMTQLYWGSLWGRQAICDSILRVYICLGIYTLAKQVIESYLQKC
jgi:hypothetical protein